MTSLFPPFSMTLLPEVVLTDRLATAAGTGRMFFYNYTHEVLSLCYCLINEHWCHAAVVVLIDWE